MAFNWTCPRCGAHTTIQDSDYTFQSHNVVVGTAKDKEGIRISHSVIKCPSPKCGLFTVDVDADYYPVSKYQSGAKYIDANSKGIGPVGPGTFRFEPRVGRPLSVHVPESSRIDYEEACLILDLSPKAAATLCRRALQGMIRDFWKISKSTLAGELKAIEQQCEPALYQALMGLKGIGNIGAHPERDINLVVDVEPNEVSELLELLRLLDAEWYVAKAVRAGRLASITAISANKAAQQNPQL